jgi:tetratricopeptide (TPR) repeat protein
MVAPWVLWLILGRAFGAGPSAELLVRQGRIDEAIAAAKAVVDADADDVATQELYVDLLLGRGMVARAVEHAEALVKRDPQDPDGWYVLGRALPDVDQSREAYETALRADPAHARAHMGMGALYEATGKLAEAEAAYGRAVAEDRTLSEAWIGRVRSVVRAGRPLDARTFAEQAYAAVPGSPSVALQLASLAPDRATAVLAATIERAGDDPRLHSAYALQLLAAGSAADALAHAHEALQINPTDAMALRVELLAAELSEKRLDQRGLETLLALRDAERAAPAQALPQYGPLSTSYPRSALVLLGRAALEEATGDRAGSLRDLLAAAELDPDNVEAAAAAGMALLDADRPGEAEPLLSQAAQARPWDGSLGVARWKALVQIDRKADALAAIEPVAKIHRFDSAVQTAYAGSLADAGRADEAYRVLKSALVMAPDARVAAAFVQIAPAAGHAEEAAALLDQIVGRTGNAQLAEAARRLRAMPKPAAPAP